MTTSTGARRASARLGAQFLARSCYWCGAPLIPPSHCHRLTGCGHTGCEDHWFCDETCREEHRAFRRARYPDGGSP